MNIQKINNCAFLPLLNYNNKIQGVMQLYNKKTYIK